MSIASRSIAAPASSSPTAISATPSAFEQARVRVRVADLAHERHRLARRGDRLRVARAQHQRLGAVRDQPGALRADARRRGAALSACGERLLALVAVAPVRERALQPAAAGPRRGAARRPRRRARSACSNSAVARGSCALVVAGARGARQQPDAVAARQRLGVRARGPTARARARAGRRPRRGRARPRRPRAARTAARERGGLVAGGAVVVGDRGRPVRAAVAPSRRGAVLERARERAGAARRARRAAGRRATTSRSSAWRKP